MASQRNNKQNITISLSKEVLRKAKVLAALRDTSVSGLLAQELESLVNNDEAYETARQQAIALMKKGFRMGGVIRATREELHER